MTACFTTVNKYTSEVVDVTIARKANKLFKQLVTKILLSILKCYCSTNDLVWQGICFFNCHKTKVKKDFYMLFQHVVDEKQFNILKIFIFFQLYYLNLVFLKNIQIELTLKY